MSSNKILLLAIFCGFFISITTAYASEMTYNTKNTNLEKIENVKNLCENKSIEKEPNSFTTCEYKSPDLSNYLATNEYKSSDLTNYLTVEEHKSQNLSNNLAAGDNKPNKLSKKSLVDASLAITKHVSKNGKLPKSVKVSAYKYSMPEFLYLLSKAIQTQNKKSDSKIKVKYNVKNPEKPSGTNVKKKISSSTYKKYATRIVNFITKHSTAPNYLNAGSAKIQYQTVVYTFARVLTWSKTHNNKFPNSLSINVKKNSKINKYLPIYTRSIKSKTVSSVRLNSKYNGESLENYLAPSKNCQVNDKEIKSLSYQITKKYKSTRNKAIAIFNWVRNNVNYKFYYNTKYGAKKTICKNIGNCVDQAHLIVALSRAVGIASRYVHGRCDFVSGNTYGHVWAQIKVGKTWYVADSSSSKNSFGVVNNWYTNSYRFKGFYSSLSF